VAGSPWRPSWGMWASRRCRRSSCDSVRAGFVTSVQVSRGALRSPFLPRPGRARCGSGCAGWVPAFGAPSRRWAGRGSCHRPAREVGRSAPRAGSDGAGADANRPSSAARGLDRAPRGRLRWDEQRTLRGRCVERGDEDGRLARAVERAVDVAVTGVDETRSQPGMRGCEQSSAGTQTSSPGVTLTITGPAWVCQGNRAPGCTVNLATTVRDASSDFTTAAPSPWRLILNLASTASVNTVRLVRNSVAMGGGVGCCAADGRTFAPTSGTAMVATACLVAIMAQGPTSSPSAKRSSCAAWRTRALARGRLTSSCAPACGSSTVIGAWTPTSPRSSAHPIRRAVADRVRAVEPGFQPRGGGVSRLPAGRSEWP
jgi:hypothetical protein